MILHSGSIFLLFHALKKSLKITCKRKFTKFKKIHFNLKINIPFAYALAKILHYAKLLKGSLKNKSKVDEQCMVKLSAQCSAIFTR